MTQEKSQALRSTIASCLNALLTTVLGLAFLIYVSIAAFTKDLLWLWPIFSEQPNQIILRCYGKDIIVDTQSPEIATIVKLVNEQISGNKALGELSLSKETLEDYQASDWMMVLELHYPVPARIHSRTPFFTDFDTLIIPLDGRHADGNYVFSARGTVPGGGSFRLPTIQPIRDYIAQQGLCSKP
jgi:hypothetical protein